MLVLRTKEEGGEGEEESVEGGEADSTDCTVSVLSIEMSGQCEVCDCFTLHLQYICTYIYSEITE